MWFEQLVGFPESADQVRQQLRYSSPWLESLANGRRLRCGELSIPSLAALRAEAAPLLTGGGQSTLRQVVADVRELHRDPANAGATFQVASQFNLLEMPSPSVVPEDGIDGYEHDRTQGPACAISCGAGTIMRNYFAPVDGQIGQTSQHQIDTTHDLGRWLFAPAETPWKMQNGYLMLTLSAADQVATRLAGFNDDQLAQARGKLRVGVQSETEVTGAGHLVTQVYCAALPIAYQAVEMPMEALGRLALQAAYEATCYVGVINAARSANPRLYLTLLGGGVFGNPVEWILDALKHALLRVRQAGLEIVVVSHERPNPLVSDLVADLGWPVSR